MRELFVTILMTLLTLACFAMLLVGVFFLLSVSDTEDEDWKR